MCDLVSIVMPSYNTAKYIADSIQSVINQTYSNWELLIVDDCSTDNTEEIVASFNDERIRFIKKDKNSGAADSRNVALRAAVGKWIAFLDSDDTWEREKLEKQIRFMENGNYHFSYTRYEEINEDSEPLGIVVSGPSKITKIGMYNYCWPGCLTVMYDAEYVGLIQIEDIKKNNDYAMWLKVCKKANCYLLDETLAKYRRGRTGSISSHNYKKLISWHYKLFNEAEHRNCISSALLTVNNLFWGIIKKIKYRRKI